MDTCFHVCTRDLLIILIKCPFWDQCSSELIFNKLDMHYIAPGATQGIEKEVKIWPTSKTVSYTTIILQLKTAEVL